MQQKTKNQWNEMWNCDTRCHPKELKSNERSLWRAKRLSKPVLKKEQWRIFREPAKLVKKKKINEVIEDVPSVKRNTNVL